MHKNGKLLFDSLSRFKTLEEFKELEELPDSKPFAIISRKMDVVYCNLAFTREFGLAENDNLSSLNTEPNLPHFLDSIVSSSYRSIRFELFILTDNFINNEGFFVDLERVLLDDHEYFVFVSTTAEERKQIENRINNLHNALEYGDVPVIITDEAGIINYSTKSFETAIGVGIEVIFKSYLPDLFRTYLTDEEYEILVDCIKQKKEWTKLISDINSNGELWFKELKLNPVKKTLMEPSNFILTIHDITNYIQKNRIIRKSEQRQRSIINNISDLLLIVRRENGSLFFESANDNFFEIFNVPEECDCQTPLEQAIDEEFYTELFSGIEKIHNIPEAFLKFRYKNQLTKHEYICKITYTDDPYENVRLFIINLNDITEQLLNEKRLKEAYKKESQLNQLKSAFLANMSHEIRTPLNAIVGYSDLLEDDLKTYNYESLPEIASLLKEGVNRLLSLVDNIVEVSIIESGSYDFDIAIFNVNSIIKSIYQDQFLKAVSKNISLEIHLDENSAYFEVDENKFRKAVGMLVDNAIKYNKPNGSVILRTINNADTVKVIIEDTGIGIDESKLEKVLEPFMQEEEDGYKRKYEGAGLGLTIAYRLTRLLKGQFNIVSRLNEGTTITLEFPVVSS